MEAAQQLEAEENDSTQLVSPHSRVRDKSSMRKDDNAVNEGQTQETQEQEREEEQIDIPTETKVSKRLTNITQQRVIVMIMSVIFSLPLLAEN